MSGQWGTSMSQQFILWRRVCVFIALCNGQCQQGVYEVVILQMPEKIPSGERWLFSFCPTNPFAPYSQYHMVISVCWHLNRLSCLDCKEMCACVFVWYSNQTAAGSGPCVCYQNTRMDVWGNEGKAEGFVLFAYILLFLWLLSDYHFARPDFTSNFVLQQHN